MTKISTDNTYIKTIAELLEHIDTETIQLSKQYSEESIDYVNTVISNRNDLTTLIGGTSFDIVESNHKNHANFMTNIFQIKDAQILHDTFIWAYSTYHNKGFSFQYFYHELMAWKSFYITINSLQFESIINLYNYLISLHEYFIQHAVSTHEYIPNTKDTKIYEQFLDALLKADLTKALQLSHIYIKDKDDIVSFWEEIILPSLYTLGDKWANAEISVGTEHSATSMCQRVMSEHYGFIIKYIKDKKNILVTTSPNELHEVGARMLSDILELNGYNVTYLGSKVPIEDLLDTISTDNIDLVLISTTLVSNIDKTQEMVKQIQNKYKIKIVLGGQAYKNNPFACKFINADYCLRSTQELLELLNGLNNANT